MKEILNVYASIGQGQGWTGFAENLIIALDKVWDVRMTRLKGSLDLNFRPETIEILKKPFQVGKIGLAIGYPNIFNSMVFNEIKIGYTMFETDKLPETEDANEYSGETGNVRDMLKDLDLLVVPSSHNADLFARYARNLPIEVVPLGIDLSFYQYYERPRNRKPFTFLMLGTLNQRKNVNDVYVAFNKLFKGNKDVRLILKSQLGSLPPAHMIKGWPDNIEIIDKTMTHDEQLKLMYGADCFVFPSRGEGFGLTPLEAMATGMPTIVSKNSGMAEYANEDYCYPVRITGMEPARGYPKQFGDVGNWYTIDVNDLMYQMRYVYENHEEALLKSRRASIWIANNFSYFKATIRLTNAIKKLIES